MRIVAYPEADVPLDLRLQVVALQEQAWPSDVPPGPEPWHDPALHPVSMLLIDEGGVVAALDILSKELVHAGARYAASGISAAVTDTAHRGRGFGRHLVEAARMRMASDGADLGIFTCDASLRRFYEGAGWRYLPGTVILGGTPEDPFPSDRFEKVTLAGFFSERAQAAAEAFVGSRVALYPGSIDKLW
jgi:aminoglycoside 2'-N-acetyltransferase I